MKPNPLTEVPSLKPSEQEGFTLMELSVSIVVIALLCTMLIPLFASLQQKADYGNCTGNLRTLYASASSYIIDKGHWPQIGTTKIQTPAFADAWIHSLEPYGATRKAWICPAIQRVTKKPDYNKPDKHRIDYLATPFDSHEYTPYRWRSQPWFVEKANVHGSGNLLIFSDSTICDLRGIPQRVQTN